MNTDHLRENLLDSVLISQDLMVELILTLHGLTGIDSARHLEGFTLGMLARFEDYVTAEVMLRYLDRKKNATNK